VYEASTNESVCRTRVKPGMLASRHLKLRAAIGDGASALPPLSTYLSPQ